MDPQTQKPKLTVIDLPTFTLVGLTRDIIQKEELDPQTGQIGKAYEEYFDMQMNEKIPHRLHPKRTYCMYYEYQNPHDHDEIKYKMVLGEMVSEVTNLPEGLIAVTVPAHRFCRFDCGPGPIPKVIIDAWQSLPKLSPDELGGTRSYDYDFEVYPEELNVNENIKLELFIGLQK
ncbi:unnamed protein product (macronuclear) [Paramecium tetraurelia]|uniref:AraC effector-binding domain-containing protein n=1 Tax=Paramecium tetraurelia TaxID=5888 RepID=A0D830_PARTE|nr:uncharacterized protein GSPATT00014164001 [Paramecium tetraurelia]CAK79197.1 unnamed protein product [Paramecium tetraurelia]|eukprot:XP_001446594.1 hypothetical protein (macronuclear) [Paramecium tetraurelia strain d4-2]